MTDARSGLSVVGIAAAVVGAVVGYAAIKPLASPNRNVPVDDLLTQATAEINKRLPMMIDAETRCDSVAIGAYKTIVYHYTIVKRSKGQFNSNQLANWVRPILIKNYNTMSEMQTLRENGVILQYHYYDKNGSPAFEVTVDPADFQ